MSSVNNFCSCLLLLDQEKTKASYLFCHSSHESVASFIVEKRRAEFNQRLWTAEMTMEDIEALDENHEGGGKCCVTSYGSKM